MSKKKLKDSEIYLEAAKLIDADRQEFSCLALKIAAGFPYLSYAQVDIAREYYKLWGFQTPSEIAVELYKVKNPRKLRVLLLCLASVLTKDRETELDKIEF